MFYSSKLERFPIESYLVSFMSLCILNAHLHEVLTENMLTLTLYWKLWNLNIVLTLYWLFDITSFHSVKNVVFFWIHSYLYEYDDVVDNIYIKPPEIL